MIASPNRVPASGTSEAANCGDNLSLTRVFASDCVETMHSSTDKADVIRRLVQVLVRYERIDHRHAQDVSHQLIQREGYGSSAIGKGLAFPHLRTDAVPVFVGAIGVAPQGINFESLDHEPTKLVFLTLSPLASRKQHINLLSRLVSLMKDKAVCMQLHHLVESQQIHQYLRGLDDQFDTSVESHVQNSENDRWQKRDDE